eukprot:c20570_g2_i1 orf=55-714(-)
MTTAADPNLEPFIDNLWYFDSVVSKSNSKSPAAADQSSGAGDLTSFSESQLPLSTGGESSHSRTSYWTGGCDEGELSCGGGGSCASCKGGAGSRRRPSVCELVEKMEEGEGELCGEEESLWMQKLGLEFTEDGAMIRRRMQNADLNSQQLLDFSEFVCLNRFIEEERSSHEPPTRFSDAHLASLHHIFRLFDKDHNGLISPSDLRSALAKVGLRAPSHY